MGLSELGEISAEVGAALQSLDRALSRFAALDRGALASLEAQLAKSPQTREAAALIARARAQLRDARNGATAARRAGAAWLSQHGSGQHGGLRDAAGGSTGSGAGGSAESLSSAALEAVWEGGLETPGGRAYFTPQEGSMREAAAALPPFSGEYTFDAHGRSDGVQYGEAALGAAELAELIRADRRWQGRPVRLFSCNTGSGDNPIAAELAQRLGIRVTAPDDLVWSFADGRVVVAPIRIALVDGVPVEVPDLDAEGDWREFDP